MILPVENYVITSHYGKRVLHGKEEFHAGVDFISRERRRVFAIAPGRCTYDMDNYQESLRWTDRKHSLGNFCIIDSIIDQKLLHIRYCHLVENFVYVGFKLEEGNYVGDYADVGLSYGAHLHLDAFDEEWKVVNIEEILKDGGLLV
jgi:murein DD-endopeptidase MepM/ murein hydrolase activator NlpD